MKREHFLVAELYRHLATFVDADREIYFCLDGEAAKKGVRENLFKDSGVPDLCFTFIDGREVAIEAKIAVEGGRRIAPSRRQYDAWFTTGTGAHKPTGWVVADEQLTGFSYWSHATMLNQRTQALRTSERRFVSVPLPATSPMFTSVRHLALHILRVTP